MHLVLLLEILKPFFMVHFDALLHFSFHGCHIFEAATNEVIDIKEINGSFY